MAKNNPNPNPNTCTTRAAANLATAERAHAAAWEDYTRAAALYERATESADYYARKVARLAAAAQAASDMVGMTAEQIKSAQAAAKAAARDSADVAKKVAYLRDCRAAAARELTKAQTRLVRCRDRVQGKRVPITADTLYDRAAAIAYEALRATNNGSRAQRADDGTVKGGGNSGCIKQVARTQSQAARCLTNAKTASAYIGRSATDFDDVRQEVALTLWESLQQGAGQDDLYAAGFKAANRWIYANKSKPAARHAYSLSWDDDGIAPQIVDVTKGFAALLNGFCDHELLAELKTGCTPMQWEVIVLTAKGNSAKMIAEHMNKASGALERIEKLKAAGKDYSHIRLETQNSVEMVLKRVRAKARAKYGQLPAAEVDGYSIVSVF